MMEKSDSPPPRKKSRFFPEGKSVLSNKINSTRNDDPKHPKRHSDDHQYEQRQTICNDHERICIDPARADVSMPADQKPARNLPDPSSMGKSGQKRKMNNEEHINGCTATPGNQHVDKAHVEPKPNPQPVSTNSIVVANLKIAAKMIAERSDVPLSNSRPHDGLTLDQTTCVVSSDQHAMLDLDRDANGNLLPPEPRCRTMLAPDKSQFCHSSNGSSTPVNLYTSPKRIERVTRLSVSSLKQQEFFQGLPPPTYIYVRSNDPDFSVFSHGFLLYPELCFVLASHMPLRDLISLYSISKDFHTIIDSRFTTTCLSQVLRKAPQSAQAYPFRSYAEFCRDDPAARLPHPNPAKALLNVPRKIPSFRWVAFILHREKVVHEIMRTFAEKGCPLPARCAPALKKIWILMDIPDNARRIALVHNHHTVTDLDLYFSMCFFVKLDMIATDPAAPANSNGLRKLLLSQRGGLDVVLKTLKRNTWQKKSDYLQAWVKTGMSMDNIPTERLDEMGIDSIFGVSREQVGVGKYEYWGTRGTANELTGQKKSYLLRPDQLVVREGLRRGLSFMEHYQRCVLYGYIRPDTLDNYAPRRYGRRIGEWKMEDYDINDAIGGGLPLAVEDGGDSLLDLGNSNQGSEWTVATEAIESTPERGMQSGQNGFLMDLYAISKHERRTIRK